MWPYYELVNVRKPSKSHWNVIRETLKQRNIEWEWLHGDGWDSHQFETKNDNSASSTQVN